MIAWMKWLQSDKRFATCLLGCLWVTQLHGQGSIEVQVVDKNTNQPAQFVNVYLAHTMMGGSSDAQGNVTMANVPLGTYQLVCSFVGYTSVVKTVRVNAPDAIRLSIPLVPKVTNLAEVEVRGKMDKSWKKNLKLFEQAFIGKTYYAYLCKIVNPRVLRFIEDKELKQLTAYADDMLVIENGALGYRYLYDIRMFKLKRNGEYAYIGLPKFELLSAQTEAQQKSWDANRRDAYQGSIRHFLQALVADSLAENKFIVRFTLTPHLIAEDLVIPDVTNLWSYGASENELYLTFGNYLHVTYQGRLMPTTYGTTSVMQTSWLKLNGATVTFNKNGHLVDPLSLIAYGYWASEGVANLLPFEYTP